MKFFLLVFLVFLSTSVLAQSSARFAITDSVIASGGTTFSSSARFQLASTVAQPLAAIPSSARFSIQGGFWIWQAPIIFAPAKSGNNFIVSIQTPDLGATYIVQYAASANSSTWQNLQSVTGNGGVQLVTNTAPGVSQRFYRLLEQ